MSDRLNRFENVIHLYWELIWKIKKKNHRIGLNIDLSIKIKQLLSAERLKRTRI
jgi:hypothetical protein